MTLSKWTVVLTSLLALNTFTSNGQSFADIKWFTSSDNVLLLGYPATWKENSAEEANAEFCINAPGAGLFNICLVKVEINRPAEGYENADIHQLADAELKMLKAQPESQMSLQVLESSFKNWNDHEWWLVHGKVAKGNKVYFTDSYKTIHNHKVYIFTYFSKEKNYLKNKDAAEKIITSVQFLIKNESGSDAKNIASSSGSGNKISDTKPANNTRIVTQSGSAGNPVQKDNNSLSPTMESQISNTGKTKEKTYEYMSILDIPNEAPNIKKYGNGKVRRLSEHQIEFTLISGSKIILKDTYNPKWKGHEIVGWFMGYSDALNSFILAKEDAWVALVNRATGNLSGDMYLDELIDEGDGNYHPLVWSPDGKSGAITRSFEEDGSSMNLYIYSPAYQKLYEKNFTTWFPREMKWLDNNTLEIKKYSKAGKFLGTTRLILQNGKWVLQSLQNRNNATSKDISVKKEIIANTIPAAQTIQDTTKQNTNSDA